MDKGKVVDAMEQLLAAVARAAQSGQGGEAAHLAAAYESLERTTREPFGYAAAYVDSGVMTRDAQGMTPEEAQTPDAKTW